MLTRCLLAFGSGLVVEGVCTLWVAAVARAEAGRAGLLSMAWAAALLLGLEQAVSALFPAVCWVAGYGAGSYLAVKVSSRTRSPC